MKVTIILILIGAFGIVTKGSIKLLEDLEIRGQVETIQTTTLLRMTRIPRDVRRLADTQTPVKDHQLKHVKNSDGVNKMKTKRKTTTWTLPEN